MTVTITDLFMENAQLRHKNQQLAEALKGFMDAFVAAETRRLQLEKMVKEAAQLLDDHFEVPMKLNTKE
jgi:hypothetical protein